MLKKNEGLKKNVRKRPLIKPKKMIHSPFIKKRLFDMVEGFFTWPRLYTDMVQYFPNKSCFVEVGVFKGRSLYYLLYEIEKNNKNIKVYGVDHYKGVSNSFYKKTLYNLKGFKGYTIICKDSVLASEEFKNNSVDFVFIDAGHEYEEVKADILVWLPKIKKGGVIAGHDYNGFNKPGGYPGVNQAVHEIFGKEVIEDYIDEDCWLVKINGDVSN